MSAKSEQVRAAAAALSQIASRSSPNLAADAVRAGMEERIAEIEPKGTQGGSKA